MAGPTKADWGKIHAKAWREPSFRKLLETDPTKAVRKYAKEEGKKFTRIVKVKGRPRGVNPEKHSNHRSAKVPPACC